ncbi:MAG: AAA family ATPase [Verrucomicrobia bacterium]|nr:AAA family ATPase [Verrucomicrobiota bacterium]
MELLQEDAAFVLYRGRRDAEPRRILVVRPRSTSPARETLKRLERYHALRSELDPAWAVLPMALVRDGGQRALVLADPGGEPLDRLLARPLDLRQFLRIALGLCAALGRLHARGMIHKDLKPAHVMVDLTSGQVWLTGFGIASHVPRERPALEPPESLAGTLAYMAPEQTGRMNRSIDSRSDLYALGVTLYEVLTGALPFSAADALEWVHCHMARQPLPPAQRKKAVPEALSAIILKLLAKTAEGRYQTAAGLEADLRRCLGEWEARGRIDPFGLGADDVLDRLLIPEKLYGRERESQALREAFERVAASGTPELVLVSGYAGIGKSSVVNELHQAVARSRGIFLSGKFDQYKRDIPYATLAQAFQALIGRILSQSEAEAGRWREGIREAVGPNGQLIAGLIPELERLLGPQPPVTELPPQEAQHRFQAVWRAFLGVFARAEHPLALFLDDLQWLDAASLELLEHLVTHPDVRHLLLIGAYRDNEVSPFHPLRGALGSIRRAGARVEDIVLGPLPLEAVSQLTADSLHQERTRPESLARLVHEKTAGNPFFAIQFLAALAEERLLEFDPRQAAWRWDLERIRARRITDNVVDLVAGKLHRLGEATRRALERFACLGNRAEAAILAVVHGASEAELHAELREAVREGLVTRSASSYQFAHDRIQEAAYSLIPEAMRANAHLQLGRLLARLPPEKLAQNLFDTVNQLNQGVALISDLDEKGRAAQLNLEAGRKARASTAYAAACTYLGVGMTLLGREGWQNRYELAFSLWLLRAECQFLCGNFEEAASLISELLKHAASKADKAAVYRLRINLHILGSTYQEAVNSALEGLRLFGIELPAHPTPEQVQAEYELVWRNLGGRPIEGLIDLPPMTDPEIQAATRVLSALYSPAFFTDTNLFLLSICRIVNLSLEHGTTDAAAHGYAYFGFILGPAFHRYAEGYRFGKLGIDLVEKYGFVAYRAKVYMTMAWVAIWTQPVTTALDFIRAAFAAAVETGDLTYACYCCDHTVTDLLVRGDHLDEVWSESEKCLDFVRKAKSRDYVERLLSQQQFIQSMRGGSPTAFTSEGARVDEAAFEVQLTGDRAIVCWYWILQLQGRFILGDHEAALAAAQKAKALLWAATGCVHLADYHYYLALTIAALFETTPPEQQRGWREALTEAMAQLREWAECCAATFLDKYALVAAEVARLDGRLFEAERLYERAIRSARENGFTQNEGIANELAGRFYLRRGSGATGHDHLRDARACYFRWGARGKVKRLDQLYPELTGVPLEPTITMGASLEQLDLTTVVKAMQAVSREIDLGKLVEALMVIAVESAGAERGLLFLPHGQEPGTAAEAATRDDKVEVTLAQAFVTPPKVPESVLRYVMRTHDRVILDDASAPSPFSHDDDVRARRLRSILCLPLVKTGALVGVLYLENNLTPRVFTPGRLAVLELLASQAAISLENARLYADLRQENCDRSKAEEALRDSEERMCLAAEAADLAMWTWDIPQDEAWSSDPGRALFGFTPSEKLSFERGLQAVHPQDREAVRQAVTKALSGDGEYESEFRVMLPDGQVRWMAGRGRVEFQGGKPRRLRGVSLDITRRKQAELEAARQRNELAHLSRVMLVGELSGALAHELNQPLTAILSNAQAAQLLMAQGGADAAELQDILNDVVEDSKRATEVIRRLRLLLKKGEVQRQRLDVNEVVQNALKLARSDLARQQVAVEADLAQPLPTVPGDGVQLQQVLLNLVVNGCDAMAGVEGSERRLRVRTELGDGQGVRVSVTDQGGGIPPDKLERIFEPFFTTKGQGMGLGLGVCRTIISAHGGRLWATNNPGRGATFQFTLPLA